LPTTPSQTPVDEALQTDGASPAAASGPMDGPVAIEVRDVEKTFRIPTHRIDSFKERAVHPFTPMEYRELRALRKISFDVHRGEFFGIVGRNGSGKSTLLKILASIYRADAGTIRMAGQVAPFIELGVGFNPNLTARENVVLNGVMMGLSQREAKGRLDAVLDFAELRDFVDLKLKNYSSGMMVRLAFSMMIQAEADTLLIDEVLAVGDAAFAQKCEDVFWEMRDAGRTIVLVTHNMNAVQTYCHRAMLLHDGELLYTGDPEEVGTRYLRLNFAGPAAAKGGDGAGVADVHARVIDAWLENGGGERVENVELGEPIRLHAVVEARIELVNPIFGINCTTPEGVFVFTLNRSLEVEEGNPDRLAPGQRVRISGTIENPLSPGRYFLNCWVARNRNSADLALQSLSLLKFVVFGTKSEPGLISVPGDVSAVPEEEGES
jgi:ABC-type polysaccharide/polyol phosphate transport system ATPase subunit